MQAIPSFSSPQSLQHFSDDHFQFSTVDKVSDDLTAQLQLTPDDDNNTEKSSQIEEQEDENEGEEEEEEDKDEDEFSFITNSDKSAISADDVFHDGQIRPIFPLFNRDLLFSDYDYHSSSSEFLPRSPVKVFVEAPPHPSSSSSSETDKNDGVAEGPYCPWSKNPTEASPDGCKKSNSTGFSKLWRFRDYLDRSNSDGRDAFVFLNNSTVSAKREDKIAEKSESSSKKKTAGEISSEKKVKVGGGKTGKVINKKGGVKGKTASLSAHEVYMRNRGSQEDDRRRSYLPYRPELVGFFTNVNGGLSRNVHPF